MAAHKRRPPEFGGKWLPREAPLNSAPAGFELGTFLGPAPGGVPDTLPNGLKLHPAGIFEIISRNLGDDISSPLVGLFGPRFSRIDESHSQTADLGPRHFELFSGALWP